MGVLHELFAAPVRSGRRIGDVPLPQPAGPVPPRPPAAAAGYAGFPAPYGPAHAPPGGVHVQGQFYPGGQFIPGDVMAKASPAEKAAVAGRPEPPVPPGRPHGPSPAAGPPQPDRPAVPPQLTSAALFSPEEMALPKNVTSPYRDPHGLFAAAAVHKPTFDRVLDTGEGVDRAVGAVGVHPRSMEEFTAALNQPGPVVIVGGLKGMARSAEKVNADYGGDWSRLHDVVRGTVAVDTVAELPHALAAVRAELARRGWKIVKQPKNKFESPTDAGYRDVNLSFGTPDGLVGEIQLNTKPMLRAKEAAHVLYEQQRSIEARALVERRDMTPAESAEHRRLSDGQRALYDRAWAESLGSSPTAGGPPPGKAAGAGDVQPAPARPVVQESWMGGPPAAPVIHEAFDDLPPVARAVGSPRVVMSPNGGSAYTMGQIYLDPHARSGAWLKAHYYHEFAHHLNAKTGLTKTPEFKNAMAATAARAADLTADDMVPVVRTESQAIAHEQAGDFLNAVRAGRWGADPGYMTKNDNHAEEVHAAAFAALVHYNPKLWAAFPELADVMNRAYGE